ncbi:MAG: tetratricopeptide repeat protein [Candidatus Competibacter sp.]
MTMESSSTSPGISPPQSLEAWELESKHSGCLLRLRKVLMAASGFRLILLEFNNPRYRDQVIRQIDGFPVKTASLRLDESVVDFETFERRLAALAGQWPAVHVLDLERWLADKATRAERFKGFNYHREALAERCPVALLLWMIEADIKALALQAPDLWAWRTEVFDFSSQPTRISAPIIIERDVARGSASVQERQARIKEIEEYLGRESGRDGSSAQLLVEQGQLYGDLGNPSAALGALEQALAIFRELDDRRQAAMSQGLMADIEAARGNTDGALKIYEEILKLFEALGDVRARAVTLGKIADVLQARGELDEALRIRQEELLPVFERLGDVRLRAVTLGQIADVYQARGQWDEALRIRREEQLPVFERLGDVRELLVCHANIGINYLARGAAGDRQKALELLKLALQDAQRLKLPEAQQIAGIIQQVQAQSDSLSSPDR